MNRIIYSFFLFCLKAFFLISVLFSSIVLAQEIFRDDFNGEGLDEQVWFVQDRLVSNPLGRTQFDPEQQPPEVGNGVLRLSLDTYNPNSPGNLFLGSEVVTQPKYALDMSGELGLEFEASIKIDEGIPNGLVMAFFTFGAPGFGPDGINDSNLFDEIDFEILSNFANAFEQQILLNVFDDFPEQPQLGPFSIDIPETDLTEFNTYTMLWREDSIEWLINGESIFVANENIEGLADSNLGVHFNFWAPGPGFSEAFDADLQPTSDPEANQRFSFEVDYVSVTAIPEPKQTALLFGSIAIIFSGLMLVRKKRSKKV